MTLTKRFPSTKEHCPNTLGGKHVWVEVIGKNARLAELGLRVCKNCRRMERKDDTD